jgi:phosphoadenosine phosphosulfate reductase
MNGLQSKIERAIVLLREFEPFEGYHLAFSGGKDSICIWQLAKLAKVRFTAYFAMTSVDPPDILHFIRKYFPEVVFLRPELSMFQLIVHKKILPTRKTAFCCEFLKEYAGIGELVVQGIRWQESRKRAGRQFYEKDNRKKMKGKQYLNPIIDWTTSDVWSFIRQYKLPFPDLYLGCFSRVGCIGCPKAYFKHRQREFQLYPRFRTAYLIAIRKAMQLHGAFSKFENPEDVFNWWVSNDSMKVYFEKKRQMKIFSDDSIV